jgi:hypothetical protein
MEGLRPRAGKGEVPAEPGPAGAVSPTFRADHKIGKLTTEQACAGRAIPLRPGRPCPCYPGLADGQGRRREVRSAPMKLKGDQYVGQASRNRC